MGSDFPVHGREGVGLMRKEGRLWHAIEDSLNALSDKDWGWWPVLFLRPSKNKEIGNRLLLGMTCLFGPIAGLVSLLFCYLINPQGLTVRIVGIYILLGSLFFFVGSKFAFAVAWNRRARRLQMSPINGRIDEPLGARPPGVNRMFSMFLWLACWLAGLGHGVAAGSPADDAAIRAAAAEGKPMIFATITGSRAVAQGKRSHQITYTIDVTQVLSGQRSPYCNYVAHFCNAAEIRLWHRGGAYLFIFDSPDSPMPSYVEPLSRFGARKQQIVALIQRPKRYAPGPNSIFSL